MLGFMILGVVGLRCVGVLACLGFSELVADCSGGCWRGWEIRGNGLFLLGLGVEIAKFAGLLWSIAFSLCGEGLWFRKYQAAKRALHFGFVLRCD